MIKLEKLALRTLLDAVHIVDEIASTRTQRLRDLNSS